MRILVSVSLAALALTGCGKVAQQPPAVSLKNAETALDRHDVAVARIEALNAVQADPGNARAHLMMARTALESGDGIAAEAELQRALAGGVAASETHHLMAQALLRQGKLDQALAEAVAAPPAHRAVALRVTGEALAAKGDAAGAEAAFKDALRIAPNDAWTWSDLGRLRLALGDQSAAQASAKSALQADPRSLQAILLQADIASRNKDFTGARAWVGRALAIDPQNLSALLTRAGIEGDSGKTRAMLATTRQVLRLDPKNSYAFQLQAQLAADAGHDELARTLLMRGGDALDDYPPAMLLRGALDYRLGNNESAIDQLDKLVSRQPVNLPARRLLAAAKWRAGDVAGTIDALRPAADQLGAPRESLTLMAQALTKQGDAAAAKVYAARAARPDAQSLARQVVDGDRAIAAADWRRAIAIYERIRSDIGDRDAAILNNLAWAYFNAGDVAQAQPLARKAAALAPSNGAVLDTLGWISFSADRQSADGLPMLQLAAQKAPANPNIRWHLAQALSVSGKADDARREAAAALNLNAAPFRERRQAVAFLGRS
ncbi:tetratricopeptide repeat protein [Flavisphingomonas formosensis]|uniref:tetratricopeptide repeat protein n=1 Tax=Flavisphingomonas formosensis TaxID=861534 RepID=UPI0012FB89E6|nr:tetratricopeptide repeat protein [Sphingomonas formosensis]